MTGREIHRHPDCFWSDRRSGRVDHPETELPGQGSLRLVYAPEASSPYVSFTAAGHRPERGGGSSAIPSLAVNPAPLSHRPRLGSRQLLALHASLSPRDHRILISLVDHPFLTTLQLTRLHFADHATDGAGARICRRVLARLADVRAIESLDRRIGGIRAGSASFVWRLGPVGERLVQLGSADRPRGRRKQPSLHHLDHALAVADAHLALLEASRAHYFDLMRIETEPACWRAFVGPSGERLTLKPDLFAVTASGDYEDSWFIEVDRGTESLPTLLRKCDAYEQYRRSGLEQDRSGVFPWVLWLMADDRQAARLRAALDGSAAHDRTLYRVVPAAGLIAAVQGASS